ncbi:hypothetical protein M0R45_029718 [Rubus argutus]|uniref:Uncharacterized protein n=1 Tax=Rubus argutus TaxID=59490 RepID=A0AAW1WD49_RUBAR
MEDGITIEEPNGVEEVAIDIDEYVVAMQRRLHVNGDGIRGTSSEVQQIWIHRVPHSLSGIHPTNPTAIHPELVSIGPYHRGTDELLEFESYKWWFLKRLLSRTKRRDVKLRDLVEAAKKLEDRTRKCYDDEDIPMSSSDFVEMMVLDGCFIIELFRHVCRNEDVKGTYDPILSKPWLIPILTRDLLKLENQLPFFVLATLFDLTVSADADAVGDSLPLLALKFFSLSFPRPNDEVLKRLSRSSGCCHLLSLFHSSFFDEDMYYGDWYRNRKKEESQYRLVPGIPPLLAFPQLPPLPEQSLVRYWSVSVPIYCLRWSVSTTFYCLGWILRLLFNVLAYCFWWSVSILQSIFSPMPWPANSEQYHPVLSIQSTTQLRPSGIKFKPIKADSFLQIKFRNRVLQIPPITINDLTITVFINCIAYEQRSSLKCFTTYIAFLSCLINSPRDVAFLCADRIITSYSHNDHYISGLFNKLGEKIHLNKDDNYLSQQFRDVEAYYCSHWGTFMRTYFSTPWSFISIFSASVLLLLTALQTVLAILSYINKRS